MNLGKDRTDRNIFVKKIQGSRRQVEIFESRKIK